MKLLSLLLFTCVLFSSCSLEEPTEQLGNEIIKVEKEFEIYMSKSGELIKLPTYLSSKEVNQIVETFDEDVVNSKPMNSTRSVFGSERSYFTYNVDNHYTGTNGNDYRVFRVKPRGAGWSKDGKIETWVKSSGTWERKGTVYYMKDRKCYYDEWKYSNGTYIKLGTYYVDHTCHARRIQKWQTYKLVVRHYARGKFEYWCLEDSYFPSGHVGCRLADNKKEW